MAQKVTRHNLGQLEQQVGEYCQRMRQGLESFDFEAKRTALKALQIKAMVTAEDVRVKGILGIEPSEPDLATTARTSA